MALDTAAGFIYRTVLKPAPIRRLVNGALLLLPKRIHMPEGELQLNPHDPVVSGALALGVYERFELELFRATLFEGARVLDIGANVGLYSVIAARRVGGSGRVLACEPEPENFSILEGNVLRNKFKNASLFRYAIADREGTMNLHLSDSNKGHHTLVELEGQEFPESIAVETITGDALLSRANLDSADIIKIDIEGAEPLALAGLSKALSQPELALFMEFSPLAMRSLGFEPEAILSNLKALGFKAFEIDGKKRKLRKIEDAAAFAGRFEGTQYANLLLLKGQTYFDKLRAYLS